MPNGSRSSAVQRSARPLVRLVGAMLAASVLSGCSEPQLQVDLPARWHEINGDGLISLRPDGTGFVENFPTPSTGRCNLATATPYSGSIEWRATADGRFTIPFEHGEVLMGADVQMMSLNWDKLVLPFCGEGRDGDYVVFSGGPGVDWRVKRPLG